MKNLTLQIKTIIQAHTEWILLKSGRHPLAVHQSEIDVEKSGDGHVLGFVSETGYEVWRIEKCRLSGNALEFKLVQNLGTRSIWLDLVPRTRAEDFSESVNVARSERANSVAETIAADIKVRSLVRVELNKQNGRYAQIVFRDFKDRLTAAISDVSDTLSPESLIASSIIWLSRLEIRKKDPVKRVWILSEKRPLSPLRKLHGCLSKSWRSKISIVEQLNLNGEHDSETSETDTVKIHKSISRRYRHSAKPEKPYNTPISKTRTAKEFERQFPDDVDVIKSRAGESVRFRGLTFFRIRRFKETESSWFGVDGKRVAFGKDRFEDLHELLEGLKTYRCFDSPNKQHNYYTSAPEAWLESILRRNIQLLEPNLFVSPIYNQFQTGGDKIDLLAIRKDGRLVVIELKVASDRDMPFQAVDYWRKIEGLRRSGSLSEADLFCGKYVIDKPAIIYLVAPRLAYQRDFKLLAGTVSKEIEIHRFDLAENWRKRIQVVNRERLNAG